MGITSYAQNSEDVLLNRVFGGSESGFYVDVGARHPVVGSVTKVFYDRGWDGINLAPGTPFEDVSTARPRDLTLDLAASDAQGEVTLPAEQDGSGLPGPAPSGQRRVPADTLANILARHGRHRPIGFIRIGAEAAVEPVVRSTDWHAIRPTVLLIAATSRVAEADLEPHLRQHGYTRAYFDGVNCFYVPEERRDLLQHFATPVNMLDGHVRFDPRAAALEVRLGSAEARAAAAEAERRRLRAELQQTTEERERLLAQQSAHLDAIKAHNDGLAEIRRQNEREIALQLELDAQRHATALSQLEQANADLRRTIQVLATASAGSGQSGTALRDAVSRLEAGMQALLARPSSLGQPAAGPAAPDPAVTQELQRLGKMLESTLLTLALDAARPAWTVYPSMAALTGPQPPA